MPSSTTKYAHFPVSFPAIQHSTTVAPLPHCSPARGGHPCAFRIMLGAGFVCWQDLSAAVGMPEACISWALITQPHALMCFSVSRWKIETPFLTHTTTSVHCGSQSAPASTEGRHWRSDRWLIKRLLTNATGQTRHQFPSLCLTWRLRLDFAFGCKARIGKN